MDLVWENCVAVIGLILGFSCLIIKDRLLKIDAARPWYLGSLENFSRPISQRYLPETEAPARAMRFLPS